MWASHCRGFSCRRARAPELGAAVEAHGVSCSAAGGIFPGQGLNPCLLHCRRIPNHWTPRKAPFLNFYFKWERRGSSFHLNTRGHWRATKWPNFSIAVSLKRAQGEGERSVTAGQWSSHNTHTVMDEVPVFCGGGPWQHSNIRGHWSHVTLANLILMKMLETERITKTGHRNTKRGNALGKWHWQPCSTQVCHKPSIYKKKMQISNHYVAHLKLI